jgi:hypothetical protein
MTYTNNPSLSLTLNFNGSPAGLYQMAISTNGGQTFAAPVAYSSTATATLTGSDGVYTIEVRVTDLAGNSAVFTGQVDLVRSAATISNTITAPTNAGSYDVGQNVTLTYSATAADPISSVTATVDGKAWTSGTSINTETLAAGTHTIVFTATDVAGNVTTQAVTITVHATVAGLTTAVTYGLSSGKITSTTNANKLKAVLQLAQTAVTANKLATAIADLKTFVSDLSSFKKTITSAYLTLMTGWANDLITVL